MIYLQISFLAAKLQIIFHMNKFFAIKNMKIMQFLLFPLCFCCIFETKSLSVLGRGFVEKVDSV